MKNRYCNSTTTCSSLIGAAVVSALALPTVVWAQTADATLRGTAPANSTVTARNTDTGLTRRTTTGTGGTYVLVGLPPGNYRVDAGPGTETLVTLQVASTSDLDLSPTLEQVIVTASRRHEMKTSEVANVVSQHEIETTPQITRNFLEFADTVPGMQFQIDSDGHTSLRGGAQSTAAVNVYIDGVGQKDYVLAGGPTGQDSTQGNPFPQLAISEYKVVTSNYKAEYGQVSSAAIIADTKSGTNEFHGQAFGNYTSDSWRAMTPSEAHAGRQTPSSNKEFGFAIGGPIIQDKAHFFVTYEGKKFATPKAVLPQFTAYNSLLPAGVVAQFGPADKAFDETLVFGKLDFEPTDADRLELQVKWRDDKQVDNVGDNLVPEHGINKKTIDKRGVLRWQHNADRWVNDLQLTAEDVNWKSVPRVPGTNGASYDVLRNLGTVAEPNLQIDNIIQAGSAGPGDQQDKGQKGTALQDDLTFSNVHWNGDHTFKMGLAYKKVKLHAQDAGNADPQYSYLIDDTGLYGSATPYLMANPYQVNFSTTSVFGFPNVSNSTNTQIGAYFQDDWAVNAKWTLNLGVRWDYEQVPSYLDWVTPQSIKDTLNSPDTRAGASANQLYSESLAKGGINLERDWYSNGHNRKAVGDEIQPRLGFSYDIDGDRRNVISGGYGRSYDRDLYNYMQLEQNKIALSNPTLNFSVPTSDPTLGPICPRGNCSVAAWDPNFLTDLALLKSKVPGNNNVEPTLLNNNLKAPYSDQFSVGLRSKVGDWFLSEAITYVHGKDGFVWLIGNRYPDGSFFLNNNQDWSGVPGTGRSLILGTNGTETKTTQLLLRAEKAYTEESGWGTDISLTMSNAKANFDATSSFPYLLNFPTTANYPMVVSNAVPKMRLVATGSIRGPWDLVFGGKFTVATPNRYYDGNACYGATTPYAQTGNTCTPLSASVNNTIGYMSLDLDVIKNFKIAGSLTGYLKADLLNALNRGNFDINNSLYADGNYYGSNGVLNNPQLVYNPYGNIINWPRTIKVEVGIKF